jgi:AraC-like DNA-binding protein
LLDLASDLERRTRLNFTLETNAANSEKNWPVGSPGSPQQPNSRVDWSSWENSHCVAIWHGWLDQIDGPVFGRLCNRELVIPSNTHMAVSNLPENSKEISISLVGESYPSGVASDFDDHLSGSNETGHMWRHPELVGVELFRAVYKRYQAARHFHSRPAIGIVSKGAMGSYARGATHALPTGTVFLINPGEVHAPGPIAPQGWVLRAFYFSNDFFIGLSRNLALGDVCFSELFVRNVLLTQTLLSLHRSLEQSGTKLELESKMLSAFAEVARHHTKVRLKNRNLKAEHHKVRRAKEFLIENHQRVITLNELARIAEFTPYHLLRTFRSTVGLTPHDFLIQIRVERAKRLLRLGHTISDIAADTGFVDQAHFTRRFKAIVGVTPGQYLPSRIFRMR